MLVSDMFCTNIDRSFDDIKIFMFTIYIHIRNIKYILRGTLLELVGSCTESQFIKFTYTLHLRLRTIH